MVIIRMKNINNLSIEQLRLYKRYLIGEIKILQRKTRQVDKVIKERLQTQK